MSASIKRSGNLLMATALAIAVTLLAPASAEAKKTHLLAMAACPPWKTVPDDPKLTAKMAASCEMDIDKIVPALRKGLGVDPEDVTVRLNEALDFEGLSGAIRDLSSRAKPEDRVVIYINLHGDDVDTVYNGHRITDEVLAPYSRSRPENAVTAVQDRIWITVSQLRDMLDAIQSEELVIVVEACQSGAAMRDFKSDLIKRFAEGWRGREAIIFSARDLEDAAYNEKGTMGLFTETLADELSRTTEGTVGDAFEHARIATHRSVRATCMKEENLKTYFDDPSIYLEVCSQMPEAYDPYGLLDDIAIGGKTLPSRWQTVISERPSALLPTDDKDPFAWAKNETGKIRYQFR